MQKCFFCSVSTHEHVTECMVLSYEDMRLSTITTGLIGRKASRLNIREITITDLIIKDRM